MTGPRAGMTGESAFVRITEALGTAGKLVQPRGSNRAEAQCPAHDDGNPSLAITGIEGHVLVHCHAGCRTEDVLAAIGLKLSDLFDEHYYAHPSYVAQLASPRRRGSGSRSRTHSEGSECGDKHAFPMVGKPDKPAIGESWFPREWERGVPIAWKVRRTCKRCGDRTFAWRQPDGRGGIKIGKPNGVMPLGGLPDLLEAIDSGEPVHTYGTEGDSDAEALRRVGVIAVTAGGVSDWKPEHLDQLDGVDRFTFCSDADKPGHGLATWIHGGLAERNITHRLVEPANGYKDVREHLEAGHSLDELVAWSPPEPEPDGQATGRWVNLDQFLDGTYSPPCPDLGAAREDGIQFLYRGLWHTVIALTTAGKTTFALWQVKAVLESGGHVVFIHFEEATPNGIIHRLKGLGVDGAVIRKRFHWGHVDSPWKCGEMAAEIERLEVAPQLAVLDGINAACGQHGWAVKEPESVGLYRVTFVHPLTKIGAAVLSLGHPPKAVNRQSESYSYGAAGWLNDVDGIGYRMTESKTPIGRGAKGSSALYVVKDRYGEVQRWGELQSGDGMPWWYMGQFVVDDTLPEDTAGLLPRTAIHVTVPAKNAEGGSRDKIDDLGGHILTHLRETTGRFETVSGLRDSLRAKKVHLSPNDMKPALERLVNRGLIEWPEAPADRKPRPGWLTDGGIDPEEE